MLIKCCKGNEGIGVVTFRLLHDGFPHTCQPTMNPCFRHRQKNKQHDPRSIVETLIVSKLGVLDIIGSTFL